MDVSAYSLWLAGCAGVPAGTIRGLYDRYGCEELWHMPVHDIYNLPGLSRENAGKLITRRKENIIQEELEDLDKKGIFLLTYDGGNYPESLRDISEPPLLLYGIGHMPSAELPRVAIIGSRKCTSYGLQAAKKIAYGLSSVGFVVVSGLAAGIDCQAHKSAIDAAIDEYGAENAPPVTIAVLGSGVDVCYPEANFSEYRRIMRYGCVISEYPPGTQPQPFMFPRRNRIISGISLGVTVVEAAFKSGTRATVNLALSQGKEIFVVPGSVLSPLSEGTNSMIKDGAIPITSHEDIVWALRRELGYDFVKKAGSNDWLGKKNETEKQEHNILNKTSYKLTDDETMLLKHLSDEPIDISWLVALTGLAPQDVLYMMTKLELHGLCRSEQGNYVLR